MSVFRVEFSIHASCTSTKEIKELAKKIHLKVNHETTEKNATGHFGKDNYWKWYTRLDNGKSKLNNSCKNLVLGNQFCRLRAATRMYLQNIQTFLPG